MDFKIADEIYKNIFSNLNHSIIDLFLCGGASTKNNKSVRDKIKEQLYKNEQLSILYPEDLFMEMLSRKKYDLLTLEKFLAHNSDVILIVCESPGSFTELGAFVNNQETLEKVVVLIKTKYKNSKSFIMQGPVAYVKAKDKNNVIFYNNDIKDAVDNIKRYFRIKGTIRKKKGIIKDIDLITGQYTFISLLLYFFREISVKDLSVYIKKLYASKNFIEKNVDLIYSSAVRRLFKEGIIKKEETRENVNQYLLTEKGFCFTKRLLYSVSIKNRTKVIDGIRIRIMESCISN